MSQNSSTSSFKTCSFKTRDLNERSANARQFLAGFIAAALTLLLLGISLALYMGPAQGDLARIGRLGERYFAPQQVQVTQIRRRNPPPSPADVVVIGDSFAVENVWQSRISDNTGLATITYHYDDVPCLDRWVRDAIDGAISHAVKVVILSSVERKFITRYSGNLTGCEAATYKPTSVAESTLPHQVSPYDLFPMDLSYLVMTALHQRKLETKTGRFTFDNTIAVDLKKKDLFSSVQTGKLIYFVNDDDGRMIDWSATRTTEAMANLKRYQAMALEKGVQLIIFVIPDKSSVYAPWVETGQIPIPDGYNLFESLETTLGRDGNYLPIFRERALQQVDFFLPNDSHTSIAGFQFVGDLMTARITPEIKQTKAAQ